MKMNRIWDKDSFAYKLDYIGYTNLKAKNKYSFYEWRVFYEKYAKFKVVW